MSNKNKNKSQQDEVKNYWREMEAERKAKDNRAKEFYEDRITDLMRLPCVYSCHKEADGTLCYLLYDWDEQGQYVKAHEGQWLCETYDGKWTVTDERPKDVRCKM